MILLVGVADDPHIREVRHHDQLLPRGHDLAGIRRPAGDHAIDGSLHGDGRDDLGRAIQRVHLVAREPELKKALPGRLHLGLVARVHGGDLLQLLTAGRADRDELLGALELPVVMGRRRSALSWRCSSRAA
jgi:hypothetical protein